MKQNYMWINGELHQQTTDDRRYGPTPKVSPAPKTNMRDREPPRKMRLDEALPCPFCGKQPFIEWWHGGGPRKQMIGCSAENCAASPSVTGEEYVEAVARWNTRAANT